MAAAEPLQTIKAELTCPICQELFRDPVTSECGHSFCRECIARLCQGDGGVACPLCNEKLRKGNLRPNRELKNIVELLRLQGVEDPRGGPMCERHQEPLQLYCTEDATPMCVVCERSGSHSGHLVVPVEEAVQEHWEIITNHLAGIESAYGSLHPLVSMDRKLLSPSTGEEAHERLKRLADSTATLFKVDTEGPRQRFEALASQPQPREPDWRGRGREVATRSELRECQESTMAAAGPLQTIKAEVTCHLCLELFRDPVMSECGHSFCRECIARHCQGDGGMVCPLCKEKLQKKNLWPHQQVKNIVECLKSQTVGDLRGEPLCETHRQPLQFYCKEHQKPACVVCKRSRAHRTHTVVPMEEAVQEHWETMKKHLVGMESTYGRLHPLVSRDRKHISPSAAEEVHDRLKRLTDSTATLFQVRTETPEERVARALDIESDDSEETERQGHSGEGDPDGDRKQQPRLDPPMPLRPPLPVSLWTALQPLSPVPQPVPLRPPHQTERHSGKGAPAGGQAQPAQQGPRVLPLTPPHQTEREGHSGREPGSEPAAETQQETGTHVSPVGQKDPTSKHELSQGSLDSAFHMISGTRGDAEPKVRTETPEERVARALDIESDDSEETERQGHSVEVTLDPATAHPHLILSEDRKSAERVDPRQDLPDNPERFDDSVCVLGSEGFTSGRRYWEVEVGPREGWAIGVARDSVQRKGWIRLKPDLGIWALDSLCVSQVPRKVGVYLDYEGGEVRFYNAETMALISSLTATFTGRLVPFFRLWAVGSCISLSPCQR